MAVVMNGDFVKNHGELKILSLVLAMILWLCVAGSGDATLQVVVAVEPCNVPAGLAVSSVEREKLAVTVIGPKILLLKLRGERIIMPLDMTGLGAGTAEFTGFERWLPLPGGVTVTRVYPSSLRVSLSQHPPVSPP